MDRACPAGGWSLAPMAKRVHLPVTGLLALGFALPLLVGATGGASAAVPAKEDAGAVAAQSPAPAAAAPDKKLAAQAVLAPPPAPVASALPPLPVLDKVLFARLRNGALHAEEVQASGDAGSSGAVRGYGVCRCSIEALWEVLTDHAQFPKFVPRVKAMEVSRRTTTGERAVQTVDATISTLRYGLDYAWDPATRRIDFTLAEDLPHDLRAVRGRWQLWPLGDGKQVLMEYQSAVDVGRAVPGFIRSYLADRGVKDTLEAVRTRAEGLGSPR